MTKRPNQLTFREIREKYPPQAMSRIHIRRTDTVHRAAEGFRAK